MRPTCASNSPIISARPVTNVELVCTENNSDAGAQGQQSTSLVNGLYYADSLGQLMQTEFNALVWWDLRNGTDTSGWFDSTLYGWRTFGDLGMVNGLNTQAADFLCGQAHAVLCPARRYDPERRERLPAALGLRCPPRPVARFPCWS